MRALLLAALLLRTTLALQRDVPAPPANSQRSANAQSFNMVDGLEDLDKTMVASLAKSALEGLFKKSAEEAVKSIPGPCAAAHESPRRPRRSDSPPPPPVRPLGLSGLAEQAERVVNSTATHMYRIFHEHLDDLERVVNSHLRTSAGALFDLVDRISGECGGGDLAEALLQSVATSSPSKAADLSTALHGSQAVALLQKHIAAEHSAARITRQKVVFEGVRNMLTPLMETCFCSAAQKKFEPMITTKGKLRLSLASYCSTTLSGAQRVVSSHSL